MKHTELTGVNNSEITENATHDVPLPTEATNIETTYASVHMASAAVHHMALLQLHLLVGPADLSLNYPAGRTDPDHMDTASVHSPLHNPAAPATCNAASFNAA